jgi:type II secretory pathway pseudopilin PulG
VLRRNTILGLGLALIAGLSAQSASGQGGERWRERQARRAAAQQQKAAQRKASENGANEAKGPANPRQMAGLPPTWVENLREMPPEERDRFLQNNEKFKNLPPQRQQQVLQNLHKWDQLTPAQKDRIRATERILEQATPEQREHFQNDIVPKLAQMAPERRQRVLAHWRRLQGMSPAEQQAALNDPKFMPGLSPDEQATVRDLNSMGIPPSQ